MDKHTRAFTTGAHIKPIFVKGLDMWVWMVVEFDGEQFIDGTDVILETVAPCAEDLQEKEDDGGNILLFPAK